MDQALTIFFLQAQNPARSNGLTPIEWDVCIGVALLIIGFLVCYLCERYKELKAAKRLKKQGHRFVGTYHRVREVGGSELHVATAQVTIEDGNLKIAVETYVDEEDWTRFPADQVKLWKGTVRLTRETEGDIALRQIKPKPRVSLFRYKRVIFSDDGEVMTVIGEGGHGIKSFHRVPSV